MLESGAALKSGQALLLPTFFWIAMTVARAFIGNVAKGLGTGRFTILLAILSAACTFGLVHMTSFVTLTIFYVVAGLLMAGIYGFIISMMSEQLPENTNDVTSAMVRMRRLNEDGKKVVELELPRRVLTALRAVKADSLRVRFGGGEAFQVDAGPLGRAIQETYREKGRRRC